MTWQGIVGHDPVVERFRRSLAQGRLASTFLFVGPPGVGKHSFATRLAQVLLCQTRPAELLDPCGACPGCVQVLSGTHPDLERIAKPADKSTIPLELLIGPPERRMQEGLCHNLALKPFMGGRKVAIIDDADHLADEGANALLKTLEEPPPRSVLILVGTSADKQLPTIRSRCQIVRFQPLPLETVADLLVAQGHVSDRDEALRLARYSEGSLARAVELAEPDLWQFRALLLAALSRAPVESVRLATALAVFLEEVGKEAPLRRARLRQVVAFAAEFYRQVLRGLAGALSTDDPELQTAAERAIAAWPGDEETAAECLVRCFDALEQIDRNANQATLVEAWIDDLAQLSGSPPLPHAA
jgi:DNA polymerase-3 subunit delta'